MKSLIHSLLFCALLGILLLNSCKSNKAILGEEVYSMKNFDKSWAQWQIPAQSLFAVGEIDIETPQLDVKGTFRLYSLKDSMIWIQVSKFGIEGGRVLIDQDSFKMINRLERTFVNLPLSRLQDEFGVNLDFQNIQNLMWGLPHESGGKIDANLKENQFLWVGKDAKQDVHFNYLMSLPIHLLKGVLSKEYLNQKYRISLNQEDFRSLNEQFLFPYRRKYEIVENDQTHNIQLEFAKVELGIYKKLGLDIPSHYTPM